MLIRSVTVGGVGRMVMIGWIVAVCVLAGCTVTAQQSNSIPSPMSAEEHSALVAKWKEDLPDLQAGVDRTRGPGRP